MRAGLLGPRRLGLGSHSALLDLYRWICIDRRERLGGALVKAAGSTQCRRCLSRARKSLQTTRESWRKLYQRPDSVNDDAGVS